MQPSACNVPIYYSKQRYATDFIKYVSNNVTAYSVCQQSDNDYCGQRRAEFNSQLVTAAGNCQTDCNSDDCRIAIIEVSQD